MKKKLFLIVSLCMLVFGLAACGEDPKDVDYNGVTYEQLESASQSLASTLVSLTDEDIENYITQSGDEITTNLMTKWKELKPAIGDYVDLAEFSVSKSGKTLTTAQVLDFTGRDVTLTCVYNYTDMQLEDITLDEIYSLGETMQKALMNTLMGLGTVFCILILISLIIYAFKVIPYLTKKAEEKKAAAAGAATQAVVAETPKAAEPEPAAPAQDDLELIAVISAAVAAAEGTSADGFVVRSIKRRR